MSDSDSGPEPLSPDDQEQAAERACPCGCTRILGTACTSMDLSVGYGIRAMDFR